MKKPETMEEARRMLCLLWVHARINQMAVKTARSFSEYHEAVGICTGVACALDIMGITPEQASKTAHTTEELKEFAEFMNQAVNEESQKEEAPKEEDGRAVTLSMPDLPIQ